MVAKLIPYSSKVHSADQMIIWMTQHRALKLHIERVEIHKKSYEADGTFGSPDHSLSQLQKVMDTTTDNGTRGLNIYICGRGLVSMLMWIMNCPSLLLTLLGRPSLFSSCYERSTSLPSIKPSPSPVLLLSVSMHHSQTFWRWSSTWS
ncbi:uncharacterized protein LOC106351751 isoform X2 [Brassica napus]|uniref:uncharacterized protein LOC106351751 isoform X2 n=1 Tax=Brassica napus TaxID=3708 RepID=UPI0006AB399F|nr:uncharacterized protein LOC106351751 isoform X2 [Brassica napus]